MKDKLFEQVEALRPCLCAISDAIFDHPEPGLEETFACGLMDRAVYTSATQERGVRRINNCIAFNFCYIISYYLNWHSFLL